MEACMASRMKLCQTQKCLHPQLSRWVSDRIADGSHRWRIIRSHALQEHGFQKLLCTRSRRARSNDGARPQCHAAQL
jgi:hypothetical protein